MTTRIDARQRSAAPARRSAERRPHRTRGRARTSDGWRRDRGRRDASRVRLERAASARAARAAAADRRAQRAAIGEPSPLLREPRLRAPAPTPTTSRPDASPAPTTIATAIAPERRSCERDGTDHRATARPSPQRARGRRRRDLKRSRRDGAGDERERRAARGRQTDVSTPARRPTRRPHLQSARWTPRDRHLRLLTETIEAVNSTLDLEEVLALVARKVADALEADACFVYLYDERADELVLRATHGTRVEEMTRRPRMRPGEGITGDGRRRARAGDDPGAGAPRPALQGASRTCPRTSTSRSSPCRSSRARSSRARSTSARASRASSRDDEIELLLAIAGQVAQSIEHAKLYDAGAAARRASSRRSRGSRRRSRSRSTSRSRSRRSSRRRWRRSARPAPRSCSRTATSRGPRAAPARTPCGCRCAGSGRQIGELVCDRDTPFTRRGAGAARARSPTTRRSRSSTGARSCAACSPRRSTTASRTTCRRSPRCCGCRRGADDVDPRKALDDSVNRILAIAAVHEVLTERRDDDVELGDLLDRLRAMLVQGLGAGEGRSRPSSSRSRSPGSRATALALVFSRAAPERARARRRRRCASSSRAGTATSCSRSPTTAAASPASRVGHGPLDRARARPRRARRDARPALERRRPARRGRVPGLAGAGGARRRRAGSRPRWARRRPPAGRRRSPSARRGRRRCRSLSASVSARGPASGSAARSSENRRGRRARRAPAATTSSAPTSSWPREAASSRRAGRRDSRAARR